VRRRKEREQHVVVRTAGNVAAAIGRHPREFVGIVMGTIAMFAIFINALFLQKGPHPAPIFVTRPFMQAEPSVAPRAALPQPAPAADAAAANRTQLIADIQRELSRRGFYDGAADGVWGAKTDTAVRDFIQAAGLTVGPEATEGLLRAIVASQAKAERVAPPPHNDPIADLIAPSKRVLAVQRALSDFGYGQIKATGIYDTTTRDAVAKFERDHRLPVTGEISDRVVRELAAMTGRPLE